MKKENWKRIPGHERYEVSDLGNVKTLFFGRSIRPNPKLLKPSILSNGRRGVWLHTEGRHYSFPVYQLVLLAFVGPKPQGMEVCHENGNRTDDRLTNLRYDTRSENYKDACMHGRRKLNPQKVLAIQRVYGEGEVTQKELACKYGVTQGHVSSIVRQIKWSFLGERVK